MKNLLLLLSACCIYIATNAQVVVDRDQWTCNSVHENLYTQLNAGKTVVIAMQGLDCPGCNQNATYLDTFASNNKSKLRVWSALQLMAGSGGTCTGVQSWQQTHGYNDIFTFLDSSNYWMSTYSAEWLVIDPADKSIKYKGFDRNMAFTEARKIFDPTSVSSLNTMPLVNIYPNPANNILNIELQQDALVAIYTIDGRNICTVHYPKGSNTMSIGHLANGMYLLDIYTSEGRAQSKILKY